MTTQPQASELDPDLDRDPDEAEEAVPEASLLPRVLAELFGTFVLVSAIIVVAGFGGLGSSATVLYVALAGGLALTGMVVAFGAVSGAHLNPAVSLGAAIAGRLAWADLFPYIVAQVLGAIAAGGLLRVIIPAGLPDALGVTGASGLVSTTANGFGVHSPIYTLSQQQVSFSTAQAFIVEAVATAVLVAVVLAATRRPNPVAPLAIGGTLTVAILIAAQVTNAAINPARATSVIFFADDWTRDQIWLFWAAPLLGGAIAGLIALLIANSQQLEEWDEEEVEEIEDPQDRWAAATANDPGVVEVTEYEFTEVEPTEIEPTEIVAEESDEESANEPGEAAAADKPDEPRG